MICYRHAISLVSKSLILLKDIDSDIKCCRKFNSINLSRKRLIEKNKEMNLTPFKNDYTLILIILYNGKWNTTLFLRPKVALLSVPLLNNKTKF